MSKADPFRNMPTRPSIQNQKRETGGLQDSGNSHKGETAHDGGGGGEEINLGSHWTIPFVGSDDMTSRDSRL